LAKDPELAAKLEDWQGHYRRLLLVQRGVIKPDQKNFKKYSNEGLLTAVTALEEAREQLRRHAQQRLVLEVLILRIREAVH
jgi:DNA polymerase III gamma/tau subunit